MAISRSLLRPSVAVHEVFCAPRSPSTKSGASAVRLADGMLERRLDGSLRRSLNAAVTAQSTETLVHEEGVDMPTATGEARIEIDATALTVHNLVSDSNCMVR